VGNKNNKGRAVESNSERISKIGQRLPKLCLRLVFFDSQWISLAAVAFTLGQSVMA